MMKKTNFSIDLIATLQQMIRFTPIGEPDKNAMCKFKVLIPEGTKVKDIIDFALTQDEWGTIEVRHGDITDVLDYERKTIDAKKGTIKYDQITDEVKEMKVRTITSYGGWSRMDYKIKV